MNPHLQVSSDPADQVRGRAILAALSSQTLVSSDFQQQDLVEHHLPELWRKLCDELQAGREQLSGVDKVLG